MTEFERPSGVMVSIAGPAEVLPTVAHAKQKSEVAERAPSGISGERNILMEGLDKQSLHLVDSIPLTISPEAMRFAHDTEAPSSRVRLKVPLGTNSQAVILLDDEGDYRWIVPSKESSTVTRAGESGSAPSNSEASFQFDWTASVVPAPPIPESEREALDELRMAKEATKKIGQATVYVFSFLIENVIERLESNVIQGLVAMPSADPSAWHVLGDDEALPKHLPSDRPARVLLLVHGTFSSTAGSFGAFGLYEQGKDFVQRALGKYDVVLGFDHRTLSVDPLDNARDLLARLRRINWPQSPRIDMIAYSRGGLVARSLSEHLLPGSGWNATIGSVVFVGCTNGGTQLAEPDNWNHLIDLYTNFVLAVRRNRSLIGMPALNDAASNIISGVAALIKLLATGIITEKQVPGLAAMEPDGDFVNTINKRQDGQLASEEARCFVVMSDFNAEQALKAGSPTDLPAKLLMRIKDWGADGIMGAANDLVVDVGSMTMIDPGQGEYVKDKLDFGTNRDVYHTNYFTHDRTVAKLCEWLGV